MQELARGKATPHSWWLPMDWRSVAVGFGVALSLAGAAMVLAFGLVKGTGPTILAVVALCLIGHGIAFASRLHTMWLVGFELLLVGYALFDRGFAYVGVPPIFIGEMVMAAGVGVGILRGGLGLAFRSRLAWIWLALALHGSICTIPYLGIYGIQAVRDAMVWAYGLYALLAAGFLLRSGLVQRVPERYAWWMPWLLVWAPIGYSLQWFVKDSLPRMPGSVIPILELKPGDVAVQLAGASAFLLVGLHEVAQRRTSWIPLWQKEAFWWLALLCGVVVAGSANRGGLISVLAASALVVVLRPPSLEKWLKATLIIGIAATVIAAFTATADLGELEKRRQVSPAQLINNITSIVGDHEEYDLEETRRWRLRWWETIARYTFLGEYFWIGKGFGINLAESDGFVGGEDPPLRSPHNGHLTLLARSGVIGLALWLGFHGTFAVSMLRAYLRARRSGDDWWARFDLWILAFWLAFMINGSFDVYLESPQGGIPFWSVIGFGIAALEAQRQGGPDGGGGASMKSGERRSVWKGWPSPQIASSRSPERPGLERT